MMRALEPRMNDMDLLLWRHAEAVDGSPDHTRELTPRGLKQARRMARWLEDNRPKNLKVLVSPTLRTRPWARSSSAGRFSARGVEPSACASTIIVSPGCAHTAS